MIKKLSLFIFVLANANLSFSAPQNFEKEESRLCIYGLPRSQPTRAVLWLLQLKSHPYLLVKTTPFSTQAHGSRSVDFLSKFPEGTIPAMEDTDGFCLSESNAIMAYLCCKYGWSDLYPFHEGQKRAKVDEILHWHHSNTRAITTSILPLINPGLAAKLPADYREINKKIAIKSLRKLEQKLSQSGGDYLCGSKVTIADLCVYADVGQVSPKWKLGDHLFLAHLDLSGLDRVKKWMETIEKEVPSYVPVHKEYQDLVFKIRSKL